MRGLVHQIKFRADFGVHRFVDRVAHAANKKINAPDASGLFGGFIASYESLCVIKSRSFGMLRINPDSYRDA